jgi:hypothetical protein
MCFRGEAEARSGASLSSLAHVYLPWRSHLVILAQARS